MHAQAAILTTTNEASVVLTGVTADVVLTPGMTEVSVKQCYSKQESIPVEAVYTFPLPLDAVLLDMHVQLGDRTLAGHVLPRQEAESSYEDAIVDGKRNVAGERNGRNPAVRFMIFAPETVAVADTPVRSST